MIEPSFQDEIHEDIAYRNDQDDGQEEYITEQIGNLQIYTDENQQQNANRFARMRGQNGPQFNVHSESQEHPVNQSSQRFDDNQDDVDEQDEDQEDADDDGDSEREQEMDEQMIDGGAHDDIEGGLLGEDDDINTQFQIMNSQFNR